MDRKVKMIEVLAEYGFWSNDEVVIYELQEDGAMIVNDLLGFRGDEHIGCRTCTLNRKFIFAGIQDILNNGPESPNRRFIFIDPDFMPDKSNYYEEDSAE